MTSHQYQVGTIKINLPDENQSYFSIFEDLAELFGKEYQNEAAKVLKSEIKEIRPRPFIEYESGYTHITTSNVDTLISVITAIIELTKSDFKILFSKVDQAELNEIFAKAKKNRPKPKEWNTGDIFSIPLGDGTFAFGQVLVKKYCTCVLFDTRSSHANIDISEFNQLKPISILHLSNGNLLNNGEWRVLFNEKIHLDPDSGSGGKSGEIGSSSYANCGAMVDLAKAYWGITPWNVLYDENCYDEDLLKGITRPKAAIILNEEDRLKYRKEMFGV